MFNRTRQCLLYADGVVVLGHAETIEDTTTVLSQIGLTINVCKTTCVINSKKQRNEPKES